MTVFTETKATIIDIWNKSFYLYKKSFSHLCYFGIIATICSVASNNVSETFFDNITATNIMLLLATLLITIYINALILIISHDIGHNKNISWKNTLILINKKYTKLIFSILIFTPLFTIGALTFLLPGLFMIVPFFMIYPSILFDNHGVIGSLKNSFKLTWGNWWHAFIPLLPFMLTGGLINYFANNLISNQRWDLAAICILISSLAYPLSFICSVVIFSDLKIRKTAKDNNGETVIA